VLRTHPAGWTTIVAVNMSRFEARPHVGRFRQERREAPKRLSKCWAATARERKCTSTIESNWQVGHHFSVTESGFPIGLAQTMPAAGDATTG
jgi:hypothetical protein